MVIAQMVFGARQALKCSCSTAVGVVQRAEMLLFQVSLHLFSKKSQSGISTKDTTKINEIYCTGDFLTDTNNDRIVKVDCKDVKYFEMNTW